MLCLLQVIDETLIRKYRLNKTVKSESPSSDALSHKHEQTSLQQVLQTMHCETFILHKFLSHEINCIKYAKTNKYKVYIRQL